jgi:hypothetical protein
MGCTAVLSALREEKLGLLQGYVVGPLICSMKYSEVNHFADDTLLSIVGENLVDCLEKTSLTKWLGFNKLKLNVSKPST